MFFQSLKKHFRYLNQIFNLFAKINVMFKSFKIYFEYFSIFLLNQKIDNFDFSIVEKKLKIIFNINFSQSVKHFEFYLKKTKYLKQYIFYYAQKTNNFQRRKILLFKNAFIKKRIRKRHNLQIVVNDFIKKKLNFFNQFQSIFNRAFFLMHFDFKRDFFIDIDVFKKRNFDVTIYYIKNVNDFEKIKTSLLKTNFQLIMFLNKMLFTTTKNY